MTPARPTGFLGAVVVGLVLSACAAPTHGGPRPPITIGTPTAPAPSTGSVGGAPPPPDAPVPAPARATGTAVPRALRPVRIAVPSIGVDAVVVELGIADGGAIEVPSRARQAGWVDTTPAPGQQGPAVLAGHVDSRTGPAVFYRLGSLRAGDRVVLTRHDGSTVAFTVDGVRAYPRDRFPSAAVYGPVPGPALRLITCGGTYDEARGGYADNVVVFAS